MNVNRASQNTLTIWLKRLEEKAPGIDVELPAPTQHPDGIGLYHQSYVLTSVRDGTVAGEKAHRWLGWVQGYLVSEGVLTLEDCKFANMLA